MGRAPTRPRACVSGLFDRTIEAENDQSLFVGYSRRHAPCVDARAAQCRRMGSYSRNQNDSWLIPAGRPRARGRRPSRDARIGGNERAPMAAKTRRSDVDAALCVRDETCGDRWIDACRYLARRRLCAIQGQRKGEQRKTHPRSAAFHGTGGRMARATRLPAGPALHRESRHVCADHARNGDASSART